MEGSMYKERIAALLKIIQAKKFVQEDNVPCKIDEGLYLGSVGAASNCFALKRLNITHILTVASSLPPVYPNDFTYKTISVKLLELNVSNDAMHIGSQRKRPLCIITRVRPRTSDPPDPNLVENILVVDSKDVNLLQYFNDCFAFIEEARVRGGGVLVHCFAGRSRSVTVVVAYLMFIKGMSLSEAMDHVRKERPVISPNIGFMLQLHDYEATLRGGPRPEELK